MYDAIVVQIFQAQCKLVGQFAYPVFAKIEIATLQVVEQIAARHVVQHYVVVVAILEKVDKVDNIGVLTHFQNLDFAPLLKHFYVCHVLLLHLLDGDAPSSLFV